MKSLKTTITLALPLALLACGGSNAPVDSPKLLAQVVASDGNIVSTVKTAAFSGKLANYAIARSGTGYTVTDNVGADGIRTFSAIDRLNFQDISVALDIDGSAGLAYRMYRGALGREPDAAGFGDNLHAIEKFGLTGEQLAQAFIDSDEFNRVYGSLDDVQFLTKLYANVLHRAPDAEGLAWHVEELKSQRNSRARSLFTFTDSKENRANVLSAIQNGILFIPTPGPGASIKFESFDGKLQWNISTTTTIALRNGKGVEIPSKNVTCSAVNPVALIVAPDCSSIRAKRLGVQQVNVTGDGILSTVSLAVIPQRVALGTHATSRSNNLIVTPAGNVLGWGDNNYSLFGKRSEFSEVNLPIPIKDIDGKGQLSNIVAASVGERNAAALTSSGEVLAWGPESNFIPGPWTGWPMFVPNPANSGKLKGIVQISIGGGNMVALAEDGTVYSWGHYIGQGSLTHATYPSQVLNPSGEGVLSNIVQISAGSHFTLALGADGKVYAWGWSGSGQTGRGSSESVEYLPAPVKTLQEPSVDLSNVVAISAGGDFAMALTKDGYVYAWGSNSGGKIGQDSSQYLSYARAVPVKDITGTGLLNNIKMVSAGGTHALALDATGTVFSWGIAVDGQLGDGANRPVVNQSYKARLVVGTTSTGRLSGIVAIGTGKYHSLAIQSDGVILIWGATYAGNLGQGPNSKFYDYPVPTPVRNSSNTGTLTLGAMSAYQNHWGSGR